MLALGDLAADGLAVVDLAAIGAEIEPAVVGVLGDHAVGGADEARGVELVVARHREFEHVDGVAREHVLKDRPVLDLARRQRLELLHALVIALHDVDLAVVLERQPQREGDAADRGELAVQRAEALGVARHLVEQDGRRLAAALFGQHVGDGAHLDVPMGAVDVLQLAHLLDLLQPAAQAAVLHPEFRIGGGNVHGLIPFDVLHHTAGGDGRSGRTPAIATTRPRSPADLAVIVLSCIQL